MTTRLARGPLSHVARGTAYEKQCQAYALRYLSLPLTQVGGANDEGVDLRGIWKLPDSPQYNVIAQCKRYKRKIAPNHLRELVGTLARYQQHTSMLDGQTTLAILFASSSWSIQTILKANESTTPILLVHLEPQAAAEEEQPVHRRYAKGIYAKSGKVNLLCNGAIANSAWYKALNGKFTIDRPILHKRPGSPIATEFTFNGVILYNSDASG